MSALHSALDALRAGRHEAALAQLLSAWRMTPEPRLGDVVEAVSRRIQREDLQQTQQTRRQFQDLWVTVARRLDPADVGRLVASLSEPGNVADLAERAALLTGRGADPRIARGLVAVLQDPPFRSARARQFYQHVYDGLDAMHDPRVLPSLVDLTLAERINPDEGGLEGPQEVARIEQFFSTEMGWWMRDRLERLIRQLRDRRPGALSPHETEILEQIEQHLGLLPPPVEGRDRTLQELLEQIRTHPRDDRLREVYADLLVEDGDPQGEFILLQYRRQRGQLTRDQERRERALLRRHWREWVGDLLPVLSRDGVRFERGFLARAEVLAPSRRVGLQVVGSPEWATVEDITLRPASEGYRPFEALLHPVARSLRVLRWIAHETELFRLLDGEQERPLHTLGVNVVALANWGSGGRLKESHRSVLATGAGLPGLRRLELAAPRGPGTFDPSLASLGFIASSPLIGRLEALYVQNALRHLAAWREALDQTSLRRLELDGQQWRVVLRRGADGLLSDLWGTPKRGSEGASAELIRALDALPHRSLCRITLEGEPGELSPVRAVGMLAERLKR